MKPEKPLMTDWYVTNYEGIIYLTNLEWNRHFVIYGHMLDSQWIHHCTNRGISVWKRTPAVLFHQVENSFTELIMFLFHNFPPRFSYWLIGGPESKLRWKTSWSQGFMLLTPLPWWSLQDTARIAGDLWICKADSEPQFLELQLCKSKFWWWLFV